MPGLALGGSAFPVNISDYLNHISSSLDNKTQVRQSLAIFFSQMLCSFSKVSGITTLFMGCPGWDDCSQENSVNPRCPAPHLPGPRYQESMASAPSLTLPEKCKLSSGPHNFQSKGSNILWESPTPIPFPLTFPKFIWLCFGLSKLWKFASRGARDEAFPMWDSELC